MVLILLSTIPPCTPTSGSLAASSPLSPRSNPSSAAASPFFAILSPLFDQHGPEDECQSVSSPAAASPGAEPPHAAAASPAVARYRRTTRVPPLMPAPAPRRSKLMQPVSSPIARAPTSPAVYRAHKMLPPTPDSPVHPRYYERQRFQSVPAVHVSSADVATTKYTPPVTVAEVIDANGTQVVRNISQQESHNLSPTPPPSARSGGLKSPLLLNTQQSLPRTPTSPYTPIYLSSPRTPLHRTTSARQPARMPHISAETHHKLNFSLAMAGMDLDLRPSPTTAGGAWDRSSLRRKPVPTTGPTTPASLPASSPLPMMDEEEREMDVPLVIEPLLLSPLPPQPAPTLAPAPRKHHRKAYSDVTRMWRPADGAMI